MLKLRKQYGAMPFMSEDEQTAPGVDTGASDKTALQIHVVNHGGDHCDRALQTVIQHCDMPGLAAWRSVTGNDLGNCFFSTTQAAIDLIKAGLLEDIFLVTGRFDHPDLDDPVYHAWLEFRAAKPHVIVNVSNLHERPLYAANRMDYYRINYCKRRIQEIPLTRLRIKARQMAERNEDAGRGMTLDIRALTAKALKPTLSKLPDVQTRPAN